MEKFFKVTKLNLGLDKIKSDGFGFMAATLGLNKDMIDKIPKEEIVMVNSDKIIGVSQKWLTGLDDGSTCMKLYFAPNEYWAVKVDENLEKLLQDL